MRVVKQALDREAKCDKLWQDEKVVRSSVYSLIEERILLQKTAQV